MSNLHFFKRRFTLASILFITANQLGCAGPVSPPPAAVMKPVLDVQVVGVEYGAVKSEPAGINCGATCSAPLVAGTKLTLTAAPNAAGMFLKWGGSCQGSAPTCQVTMDAAQQVSAQFSKINPGSLPPTVASIAPFYISKAGGTSVIITGSNFHMESQVTIGGTPVAGVSFISPTQLQVIAPAGAQAGCAPVVVTNPDSQQISVASALAYQPTTVSYASALTSPALANNPHVVRAGDFNRDGKMDLLIATTSGIIQYLSGNGDGTFASPADVFTEVSFSGLEVADFDKDGKLDVLALSRATSKAFLLLGNGDGTFTLKSEHLTGTAPVSLSIGDLDADDRLDFVTANAGDSSVSVFYEYSDGLFASKQDLPVGAPITAVKLGDVNRDGLLDIVAAANDGRVYFLLSNVDGTFQAAAGISVAGGLHDVALGDVDGDGTVDFVTSDNSGTDIKTRLQDSMGGYTTAPPNFTLGVGGAFRTNPYAVGLWDLDFDGQLDVVATSDESGVSYFLNQGGGNFASRVDVAVGLKPQSVIFQDLNGDCLPDFVVANQDSASASAILNTSR